MRYEELMALGAMTGGPAQRAGVDGGGPVLRTGCLWLRREELMAPGAMTLPGGKL